MNNIAVYGGAVLATDHSDIIFSGNSTVTFTKNNAIFGATVFSNIDSKVINNGNSTVIFNGLSPKWCNNTCLPHTDQGDVVTIDSSGTVWCSYCNEKSFICVSKKCYCSNLEDILNGLTSDTLVNITDNVTLSSVIELHDIHNISIIGYNKLNINAICVNGGGINLYQSSNLTIEGITWIKCGNSSIPVINIHYGILHNKPIVGIIIQNCTFQQSLGQEILLSIINEDVNISHCNFINNHQSKVSIACKKILSIHISYKESIQVSQYCSRILYMKNTIFYNN